ncbi:MAG TPA: YciI family protein [Acidimicrobiales bacterium]|nr:YciI family protein [Acidimicrobiales bacterium]
MRYLALLGGDESAGAAAGTPEFDAVMEAYMRFGDNAGDAIVTAEALEPSSTATTVRHGDFEPLVTAGPYAETIEVLGGFYVLEAETLDDAIELARQIPAASDGWVSLRPMVDWFDKAAEGAGPGDTARYVAFIYGKETEGDQPGTPAWDEGLAAHQRFMDTAGDAVLAGGAIHPIATATTVQVRDGEVIVTDGPYAESAEVVGGFYLLGAADRDEAVALAKQIPAEAIELRPIMELGA